MLTSWAASFLVAHTKMASNVVIMLLLSTAASLQPSYANVYHQQHINQDRDQLFQGSESFPTSAFMLNHAGLLPTQHLDDQGSDSYQSSMNSDLIDLLDGYIIDPQQETPAFMERDKIRNHLIHRFSGDDNIETEDTADDVLQSIVNSRRADSSIPDGDQNDSVELSSSQTIDLDGINKIISTFNNNDLGSNQNDRQTINVQDQAEPEMIEHQPLLTGHQYVQGGAGEGHQLLGPEGNFENIQVIKTDTALPSYCDPPNPCPIGYTSADGCIEDFVNTASFSRKYQANQNCACDSEHSLFDCPSESNNKIETDGSIHGSNSDETNTDTQLTTLARTIQNRLEVNSGDIQNKLDKLFDAKANNDNNNRENPFLEGEKLPIVAKKAPKVFEHRY